MNQEITTQEMMDAISLNYTQMIANLTLENAQLKIVNKKLGEENQALKVNQPIQN